MKRTAVILCLVAIAAYAEIGLKDVYANYFRIGTCYPSRQNDQALQNVILTEFNSLTHENELKPEATLLQTGSTDDDIKVQLSADARLVMQFCVTNSIPLRGHTLVWHSQTPNWFFYANMQNGNQNTLASKAVMYKRMESYIKNLFALIKQEFPSLNLYAYDVVNEIYEDNGSHRDPGFGKNGDKELSPWVSIFGDNSFVDSAFTYARRHAPPDCKLFYNDFNEYHPNGKRDSIANMAKRLKDLGVLDGIGMQSHLSTDWPPLDTYKTALEKFIQTGSEIHVTELDITVENGAEAKQVELYRDVFKTLKEARDGGANITSVSVWGVRDDLSWRKDKTPLLFTQEYTKKPAYNSVVALIPERDWGDGSNMSGGDYALKINITPAGSGNVDRSPSGSLYYNDGEEVTLTAKPNTGWKFKKWSGDVCGTQASTKVIMNSEKNVTAHFVLGGGDDNIVQNGNFSSAANWTLQKNGSSAGDFTVSGEEATITMTTAPTTGNVWDFQLIQSGLPLIEGYTYKLTFDASATAARDIGIVVQKHVDPWPTYYGKDTSLTTAKSSYEFVFKMDTTTDDNGRLAFNFGASTAPVKLSNVKLVYEMESDDSDDGDDDECEDGIPGSSSSGDAASSSSGGNAGSSSSDNSNSPIRMLSSIPGAAFQVRAMSDGSLLIDANSPTAVEIYDLKGNKVAKFNVSRGLQKVNLSLPSGMYFAKAHGKVTKFMLK
jgi:GH35 family endo-1,4-beta-xylanase